MPRKPPTSPLGPLATASFPGDPLEALLPPRPAAPAGADTGAARPADPEPVGERAPRLRPPAVSRTDVPTPPPVDDGARTPVRAIVSTAVLQRARAAVYWEPGLTLTALVERGLELAVAELETARGEPYQPARGRLRRGRPPIY
jgi:hypothetical protein